MRHSSAKVPLWSNNVVFRAHGLTGVQLHSTALTCNSCKLIKLGTQASLLSYGRVLSIRDNALQWSSLVRTEGRVLCGLINAEGPDTGIAKVTFCCERSEAWWAFSLTWRNIPLSDQKPFSFIIIRGAGTWILSLKINTSVGHRGEQLLWGADHLSPEVFGQPRQHRRP